MKLRMDVRGLHCADCAARIEREIGSIEGVNSARLDMIRMRLVVDTDLEPDILFEMVQQIADTIEPGTEFIMHGSTSEVTRTPGIANIVTKVSFTTLFIITFISAQISIISDATSSIIYIVVFAVLGLPTIVSAIRGLVRGNVFTESFLMTVATVGAVIIGEYMEAAAVMTFFSIGGMIEHYALDRSRGRIEELLELGPTNVKIRKDEGIIEVPADEVSIGDEMIVLVGERIRIDGIIIEGHTSLDMSALTGESLPRYAVVGDDVLSGSINMEGPIVIRATMNSENSAISRIMTLIEEAGEKKAKSERFITRFAKVYTPVVCTLAIFLAGFYIISGMSTHEGVYRALTFLVLSCPCALVISIPLTVMGGIGCMSNNGILVKGGNYLEMLAHIDTFAFDKTGTLTSGRFSVVSVVADDPEVMVHVLISLERYSSHPLAQAVCEHFEMSPLDVTDVEELAGKGMRGIIEGKPCYVGNASLMSDLGHAISTSGWFTCIHVVVGDTYLGYVELDDEVRDGAKETIRELRFLGVRRIVMLSGDRTDVAERKASELLIDEFHGDMFPEDKLGTIERLISQSEGITAFVGDGINDGAALRRADIGISMGDRGSDTAMEASDVVISGDDVLKIPLAMRISRKVRRITVENVIIAFGLKFTVLVMTLYGTSQMWMGVVADVGACLIAILNSLRVLRP